MTTGESDTDGPSSGTVVIVEPADGSTFPGTPDAVVKVTAEYTGDVVEVIIHVDDETLVPCALDQPSQCTADVTLAPGTHTLVAVGSNPVPVAIDESLPITVKVTMESATTTGDGSGGSSGGGSAGGASSGDAETEGSTGNSDGSGGTSPEKVGCDCEANGGPGPGLGLLLGAVALDRRRRTR